MTLKDVMTRDVDVLEPRATIGEAAKLMRESDIGAIPVCDGSSIQGVVTDRDMVTRGIAQGLDANSPIEKVMTTKVEWLFEDHDLVKAAELMQQKQIRRIVVVDRNKKLVGMLSLGDVARSLGDQNVKGQTLEAVSEPPSH